MVPAGNRQGKVCANKIVPDQTAPRGAVWSGTIFFAKLYYYILQIIQIWVFQIIRNSAIRFNGFANGWLNSYALRMVKICMEGKKTAFEWNYRVYLFDVSWIF